MTLHIGKRKAKVEFSLTLYRSRRTTGCTGRPWLLPSESSARTSK